MEGLGNPFLGNHLPLGNNDFIETLHENKIQDTENIDNKCYPSRPNPGRRKKINLNFYFRTSLCCLKKLFFILV